MENPYNNRNPNPQPYIVNPPTPAFARTSYVVSVKLQNSARFEDCNTDTTITSVVKKPDHNVASSYKTVAEFARDIVSRNATSWILRIVRRHESMRNKRTKTPFVIIFGGGYDLIVLLEGADMPQDMTKVPHISVAVSLTTKAEANAGGALGVTSPGDGIFDHVEAMASPIANKSQDIMLVLSDNSAPYECFETSQDRFQTISLWTNPKNLFEAVRIDHSQKKLSQKSEHLGAQVASASAPTAAAAAPPPRKARKSSAASKEKATAPKPAPSVAAIQKEAPSKTAADASSNPPVAVVTKKEIEEVARYLAATEKEMDSCNTTPAAVAVVSKAPVFVSETEINQVTKYLEEVMGPTTTATAAAAAKSTTTTKAPPKRAATGTSKPSNSEDDADAFPEETSAEASDHGPAVAPVTQTATDSTKKRGRPKGSKNKRSTKKSQAAEAPPAKEAEPATAVPVRAAIKKTTDVSSAAAAENNASGAAAPAPDSTKKRVHPKGSKNKKTTDKSQAAIADASTAELAAAAPDAAVETAQSSADKSTAESAAAVRAAAVAAQSAPAKKRGRPKGSKNKKPEEKTSENQETPAGPRETPSEAQSDAALTKKRGRPKRSKSKEKKDAPDGQTPSKKPRI